MPHQHTHIHTQTFHPQKSKPSAHHAQKGNNSNRDGGSSVAAMRQSGNKPCPFCISAHGQPNMYQKPIQIPKDMQYLTNLTDLRCGFRDRASKACHCCHAGVARPGKQHLVGCKGGRVLGSQNSCGSTNPHITSLPLLLTRTVYTLSHKPVVQRLFLP